MMHGDLAYGLTIAGAVLESAFYLLGCLAFIKYLMHRR